ncbi:MAG: Toll-interleukin receptor [Methanohalophilus sp.]|jgi:hypothetical protein|nr:MAG: Toll-interleukin receptor [Methanohalophilus sp.]
MGKDTKLKLFVSYCHKDNTTNEPHLEQFEECLTPLVNKGLVEVWHDNRILSGEEFQDKIDCHLDDADIICLFISEHFFDSYSCMDEKNKALELNRKKAVPVIPIILSECDWLDHEDISMKLALPKDGIPISKHTEKSSAWQFVQDRIEELVSKEKKMREIEVNEKFQKFLQDTEMLTKAHSQKKDVFLDDIFVCIELAKYDEFKEKSIDIKSDHLIDNIYEHDNIMIAGEDQSGKTTLCKRLFSQLRDNNYFPVYVSDEKTNFVGKIKNNIENAFIQQYNKVKIDDVDMEKIIPIIDDFHKANNKEKHIQYLSTFPHCVVVVDDIFGLNIKDEKLISSFTTFRIKELKPSLRYELIKKWEYLSDKKAIDDYKGIDDNIKLIDTTLGKNLGKGIMPAYPFFVLSTIVTYETFMPLDQEITSQGYCYQAFIYHYLRNHGVRNDEIDIYINFLTEVAAHMHEENKESLNLHDFNLFMESYKDTYNLPIEQDDLLETLYDIVHKDSFSNYSFRYPYFYYFFVAKHIAENILESKEKIKTIIENLHVDENAYIAIFLTHHSKNTDILRELENFTGSLFEKYNPATLTKSEMKFFDEQAHLIVEMALPSPNSTPENERSERLRIEDKLEESREHELNEGNTCEDDSIDMELRRSIKTVEVMGCIIRNRAGSLKIVDLKSIFTEGMKVHLRILSCLFDTIKSHDEQEEMVEFLLERLEYLEDNKNPNSRLTSLEKREKAKKIFWNMNLFIIYGVIVKIVHSLGSDKLIGIINNVCDEIDTPSSFLVKHGILMMYHKNLRINDLSQAYNDNEFSEAAKKTIKLMIIDHCSLHKVDYRDRQSVQNKFGIPSMELLPDN